MSDGSEWLECFRKTVSKWDHLLVFSAHRGGLSFLFNSFLFFLFILFFSFFFLFSPFFTDFFLSSGCLVVIFLHLLLFGDGMQLWKLRQQGFEVITSTLGEFDEGLRSSTHSPAIQLNFMASKRIQEEVFGGKYDNILELFRPDLEDLACGVDFWCDNLRGPVTVVAVMHGFEGDLPGKYKAGGCRNPSNCDSEYCPVCPGTRLTLHETIMAGTAVTPRPATQLEDLVKGHIPGKVFNEALLIQRGLSRVSGATPLLSLSMATTSSPAFFFFFTLSPLEVSWC